MELDADQEEMITNFGKVKGEQYYGAIKELQDFLDPNVYND